MRARTVASVASMSGLGNQLGHYDMRTCETMGKGTSS